MPDPSSVQSLFSDLAPCYDRYNRLFSLGLDLHWRQHLVQEVAQLHPREILDVACGSGDVALALQQSLPTAQVVGLDFCAPLLAQAKSRGLRHTIQGDALAMPCNDGQFDTVTLAFGLRNFSDRKKGLREMARVTRAGDPRLAGVQSTPHAMETVLGFLSLFPHAGRGPNSVPARRSLPLPGPQHFPVSLARHLA